MGNPRNDDFLFDRNENKTMSMVRIAFSFDYQNFVKRIASAFEELQKGRISELRCLAKEIAGNHPAVWSVLDAYYIFPNSDDFEETEDVVSDEKIFRWVMMIMAKYCFDIDGPVTPKELGGSGIDEEIQSLLTTGRPLSSVLTPIKRTPSLNEITVNLFENMDNFYVGWLSVEEIKDINGRITVDLRLEHPPEYKKTIKMLQAAINTNTGLILGISL